MKTRIMALVALAAWAILAQQGCKSSAPASLSEAQVAAVVTPAVMQTLDEYFLAVDSRNPTRFLAFFVDTEDLTVIEDKDLRWSRKDFTDFVDGFFKEVSEIQATWEKREVFVLSQNSAVAVGIFKVIAKDSKGAPMAFRNAFTFVMVKRGERWLVKHVHESSLPL